MTLFENLSEGNQTARVVAAVLAYLAGTITAAEATAFVRVGHVAFLARYEDECPDCEGTADGDEFVCGTCS